MSFAGIIRASIFALLSLLLLGCDGHLGVSGKIIPVEGTAPDDCIMTVMSLSKPLFGEERVSRVATTPVGMAINEYLIIGGPVRPHWVVISCDKGKQTYKSHTFEVPAAHTIELGSIVLRAAGEGGVVSSIFRTF